MAPTRNNRNRNRRSKKEGTPAGPSNQQTAPFAVPSSRTFTPNIPPQPNIMAGTSIPWADIDALFADMPDMETASAPDAAHQASEGTHPESFEDFLAEGSVDFLGGGSPQMLDAPHPGMGAENGSMQPGDPLELYIDPRLLTLSPQPTATPAEDERRSNLVLRELLHEASEKIDELNDQVGVLTLQLDKYQGPNTGDVVTNFQRRITKMSEERRDVEVENEGLQGLITEQQEKIKTLEAQVASYASGEETIRSQIDNYQSAAQASDKRLEDLTKQHDETRKTLESKLASYASAEQTIKSQIEGYQSAAQENDRRLVDLNKQLEETLKRLEGQVASSRSQEEMIKSQQAEVDSYKSATQSVDKRLEDAKKQHEEKIKTLESQVASNQPQEETIKSQQAEIDNYKSATQAVDKRLEDAKKQYEEKIKTLESQVASNKSQEETIKSQQAQIDGFKSAAQASDKRLKDLTTQHEETIKRTHASAEKTIKSQKEQLDRYVTGAKVGDKAIKDYQAVIERYKEGEMNGNQTLSRYRQTISDLQAALNEQKTAADELKTKCELQEMAMQERSSNYDELQNTLAEQHAQLDSKDEQITTQKERIRQLTSEVTQHLASIKMADEEITRLTNAANEKEQREGSHRDQRRVLKAKAENLEVELDNTTAALEEARAEIKALQVESREKGYTIQRLEESQGSYVKAYNENLTLQETLRAQDEDMEALKGDLQDLEEEIARLRNRRGRGERSSRSESREEGERERVAGVGGYTTLEGVLGQEDKEDDNQGGEPAGPAEGTGPGTGPAADGGIEEEEKVGGTVDVDVQVEEEEVPRPAPVELAERIVEVPTMVYCPWLWWKMPYQALMLLLTVVGFGGLPSVSAVFWKFVGLHLFAVNWALVKFFGRRIEVAPLSPRPRHLPHPAKVMMLLAWHLVVYVCIGLLLYLLSLAMAERTMWLRANGLSRATLIGLRESLRQSPNFGNPIIRFTLRLVPRVTQFEKVAGRWLPGNRGVFG